MFVELDKDKSGFLDRKELKKALISIGIAPSYDELNAYFQMFDKNKDQKISEAEFSHIVKDFLQKEMSNEEIIDRIINEFKVISSK